MMWKIASSLELANDDNNDNNNNNDSSSHLLSACYVSAAPLSTLHLLLQLILHQPCKDCMTIISSL